MAAFEFIALDQKGRQKKGILEGDTPRQIRTNLRDQGLVPLEVEAVTERHKKAQKRGWSFTRPSINKTDLALITRQEATLVNAAIPVEETLKAVADQCEKPKHKAVMMGVRSKVVEGFTLADAMRDYPRVFDHLYCSMVEAGERSGHLDGVLERLADYTEDREEMGRKISSALTYPFILAFVSIGIIVFLLSYVVPKIVNQYRNLGGELPWLTQALINVSDFTLDYGLIIGAVLVVLFLLLGRLLQIPAQQKAWHKIILKLPLIGRVSRNVNAARFARTLAILNASSVPLLEALKIAGDVMTNVVMREAVQEARAKVREGSSLKGSLQATGLFPPMMLHMIGSGESSGELDKMLNKAADNQDRQFEHLVGVLTSMVGPIMILVMGGFVLTIVLAILLPIFQMNQMMSG